MEMGATDISKIIPEGLVIADRQGWVTTLHSDIINTFSKEYENVVTPAHSKVLEEVCNLLISLIDGSNAGWYCIPMQVGQGKTEAIKHLIKFIHERELPYSIALSAEKIVEIQDIYNWLVAHGVPEEKLAQVHSQTDNLKEVFETLSGKQFIIHTHAKLRGGGYLEKYFTYKGNQRDLFVFDESMLGSISTSATLEDTYSYINSLMFRYTAQANFSNYLPVQIHDYFSQLSQNLLTAQETLKDEAQIEVYINRTEITRFSHNDLVRYGAWLDSQFNTNFFSVLLQIGSSSPEICKIFIEIEAGSNTPYFLAAKESISPSITNLVTTDASRATRSLFKYSSNPVVVYPLSQNTKLDNLSFHTTRLRSGRTYLKETFHDNYGYENLHLIWLYCIVKETQWKFQEDKELPDEPKFLIFHSKETPIRDKSTIKLLNDVYGNLDELNHHVFFETFGKENATNEYRDCDVVIFMGLPYKPYHVQKALLLGETRDKIAEDSKGILEEIKEGELLLSLHQGSGRGKLRIGLPQSVYFCDTNLAPKIAGLKEAFPGVTMYEYLPQKLAVKMVYHPDYKSNEELQAGMNIRGKTIISNTPKWEHGDKDRANNFIKAARNKGIEPDGNLVREYLGQTNLKPQRFLKSKGFTWGS